MSNYVAVLLDGTEYFEECNKTHENIFRSRIAENAVRAANLTTKRSNPISVPVKLYRIEIVKGQMKRVLIKTIDIVPPLERMTAEEFNVEEATILAEIPVEFHSAVSYKAYEDGHAYGHEEVLSHLQGLVEMLKEPIRAYEQTVIASTLDSK